MRVDSKALRTVTGLAVDIDDTLALTAQSICAKVLQKFPIATNPSPESLVELYGQPGAVSAWRTEEAQSYIRYLFDDLDFLRSIPPLPGAVKGLQQLSQTIGVALYLSSRIMRHEEITKEWLRLHDFPDAPVILRDPLILAPDWKLTYLEKFAPNTYGLLDNDLDTYDVSKTSYAGKLFHFGKAGKKSMRLKTVEGWTRLDV